MRLLLPLSLATAVVSVGTVVYLYVPLPRTARSDRPPVPLVTADPSPVRVIPLGSGSSPAVPVSRPAVVSGHRSVDGAAGATVAGSPGPIEAIGPAAQAKAVGPEPAAGGDVLASVGRTLDDIRAAEAGPAGASAGSGLADEQVEALRQLAARRKVRPVTRMSFPLEPGAEVPAQVYLHPVPPEMSGLAPGEPELGFAVVNDRFVVVGRQSRRVVALSTAR